MSFVQMKDANGNETSVNENYVNEYLNKGYTDLGWGVGNSLSPNGKSFSAVYGAPTGAPVSGGGQSVSPILQPEGFNIDELMKQLTASFQQMVTPAQTAAQTAASLYKKGTTMNQLNLNANNQFRSGLNGASVSNTNKQQAVSRYLANDMWKNKISGGGVSG